MITIVNGDLLNAKEDIIGHQVNCQKKMGSGVALQIKKKFPDAYSQYINFINEMEDVHNESPLGLTQYVKTKGKIIANIFGQDKYGYDGKTYTSIKDLRTALEMLSEHAKAWNLTVALPYKIASDRGGADWDEVYGILKEVFQDSHLVLYKHKNK